MLPAAGDLPTRNFRLRVTESEPAGKAGAKVAKADSGHTGVVLQPRTGALAGGHSTIPANRNSELLRKVGQTSTMCEAWGSIFLTE